MDQEPDVIRQDIEDTRASLTDKIETLECEVRATVLTAKETVEGTIENVKDAVEETLENVKQTFEGTVGTVKEGVADTVESVKEAFDLSAQVDRHPWAMMGGSLLAGFLAGRLFGGQGREPFWGADRMVNRMSYASAPAAGIRPIDRPQTPPPVPSEPGWTDTLRSQFGEEINMVKGLAIGAAIGVARDLIKQSLPQLAPQIDDVMNRVTSKLGGEPIHRPLVEPSTRTY